MKKIFLNFPEYLNIHVLCPVSKLEQSVVLFIIMDTNGHCSIVSVGIISLCAEAFKWLLETFKQHNPYWKKVKYLFTDLRSEKKNISDCFPTATLLITFFEAVKSLNSDFKIGQGISAQDVKKGILIFEKMMFVDSENEYIELLKEMRRINPHMFVLFKTKWHPERDFWTYSLYLNSKVFLKGFNSFMLNLRKLKLSLMVQENLQCLVEKLHKIIVNLRSETFKRFTTLFTNPSASYMHHNGMRHYAKTVTPFGCELLYEQLTKSSNLTDLERVDLQNYKINQFEASSEKCSCRYFKNILLPCQHIFAVRKHQGLAYFISMDIYPWWTEKKYMEVFFNLNLMFQNEEFEEYEARQRFLRFKETVILSQELWRNLNNCSEETAIQRLETLQSVLKCWKSNMNIEVKPSEKPTSSTSACESLQDVSTDHFKMIYGVSFDDIDSDNNFTELSLIDDADIDFL